MKALKLAESIEKYNAGKPYDRIDLAASIDMSPNSSSFRELITSSTRYGLTLGGRQADKISLTDLGSSIVTPISTEHSKKALRQALLYPPLFSRIYSFYDKKILPREQFLKNSLRKEFHILAEDVDSCYEVIMQNIVDYDLLQGIKDNKFLKLDRLSLSTLPFTDSESKTIGETEDLPPTEEVSAVKESDFSQISTVPKQHEVVKPRVFISHSKNKRILEQIRQMLQFGGFEFDIAEEQETTAIPIPEKVFGLMRNCNCAVIIVTADEQEKHGNGSYGINQNVLIEIGAAFLRYDRRVILLVDKRLKLPSNLQGLYVSYFEGDDLSWEAGMKLQMALAEFRDKM